MDVTREAVEMKRIKKHLKRGATMVEYGLMVALIAIALVVILQLLGEALGITFTTVIDKLGGG